MKIINYRDLSTEDKKAFDLRNEISILGELEVQLEDGSVYLFLDGKLNCLDGPAMILPSGTKKWYRNGVLHREDGPAVEYYDRSKIFYINGKKERYDGPAYVDGALCMWFINDHHLTKDEVRMLIETKNNKEKVKELVSLLKLKYCDAV